MIYVVIALIFMAVAVVAYSGLSMVFSEERQVSKRLQSMSEYEASQAGDVEPLLTPFSQRVLAPVGSWLRDIGTSAAPRPYIISTRRKLVLAGSPRGIDAGRFVAIKLLGTISVVVFWVAISLIAPLTPLTWLLLVLPLTALAFFGPDIWLSRKISARQLAIRRTLPDMLDMLTISVEAGLGFDAAIAKLVRNSSGPLAEEFARMLQEVQAGVDRGDALRNVASRTDVPELSGFVMAIIQAEVFGISVANVLRTQAAEMRLKRKQFAEEMAQKAPVKMIFPLVLCILPATLIVVLGPAFVALAKVFG